MAVLVNQAYKDDCLRHKSLILFPLEATKPYWSIRLMFSFQYERPLTDIL